MFSRPFIAQTWRDVRPYVIFSAILFFAGVIVGGTPSGLGEWLNGQLKDVGKLAELARNTDNPQMSLFWVILINNFIRAVTAIYFGVVAAIFPLFMLLVNGMILGFLFGGIADQGGNVWLLVVEGILPHGILELPAIFLAGAFGIRLGLTALKGVFGSMFGKAEAWEGFTRTIRGSIPALVLVSVMLLVAAVIESTFTYWLVS